jgi:hypothetical protein
MSIRYIFFYWVTPKQVKERITQLSRGVPALGELPLGNLFLSWSADFANFAKWVTLKQATS